MNADGIHNTTWFIERRRDVAQRSVEIVIGRLVTDEAFRTMFLRDPAAALTQFIERGYELTPLEVTALKAIDPGLWTQTAEQVDPRLQKIAVAALQGVLLATPEEEL